MNNGFDFSREICLVVNQARGRGVAFATLTADLGALSTALGTDPTTHDRTIQAPPAALELVTGEQRHIRESKILINRAKADRKAASAIKSDLDAAVTALGGETILKDITLVAPTPALHPGNKHT